MLPDIVVTAQVKTDTLCCTYIVTLVTLCIFTKTLCICNTQTLCIYSTHNSLLSHSSSASGFYPNIHSFGSGQTRRAHNMLDFIFLQMFALPVSQFGRTSIRCL